MYTLIRRVLCGTFVMVGFVARSAVTSDSISGAFYQVQIRQSRSDSSAQTKRSRPDEKVTANSAQTRQSRPDAGHVLSHFSGKGRYNLLTRCILAGRFVVCWVRGTECGLCLNLCLCRALSLAASVSALSSLPPLSLFLSVSLSLSLPL